MIEDTKIHENTNTLNSLSREARMTWRCIERCKSVARRRCSSDISELRNATRLHRRYLSCTHIHASLRKSAICALAEYTVQTETIAIVFSKRVRFEISRGSCEMGKSGELSTDRTAHTIDSHNARTIDSHNATLEFLSLR